MCERDSRIIMDFLRPGCQDFEAKLRYFSAAEKWLDTGLPPDEERCLEQSFEFVKRRHETRYYHTLFHLLTCAFCLDRGDEILSARSHPHLPRLADEHPGELIDLVKTLRSATDQKSRYFQLLYQKLGSSAGIMVRFSDRTKLVKAIVPCAKAAGDSRDTFPRIPVPSGLLPDGENISLCLLQNPVDDSLEIGFQGGTARYRSELEVSVSYLNGDCEQFEGRTLAIGGTWSIKASKAKLICRVEVIWRGRRP